MAVVKVSLRDHVVLANACTAKIANDKTRYTTSTRFKIIDSVQDSLFLADVNSGSGPESWRRWPSDEPSKSDIPGVIEISMVEKPPFCG